MKELKLRGLGSLRLNVLPNFRSCLPKLLNDDDRFVLWTMYPAKWTGKWKLEIITNGNRKYNAYESSMSTFKICLAVMMCLVIPLTMMMLVNVQMKTVNGNINFGRPAFFDVMSQNIPFLFL